MYESEIVYQIQRFHASFLHKGSWGTCAGCNQPLVPTHNGYFVYKVLPESANLEGNSAVFFHTHTNSQCNFSFLNQLFTGQLDESWDLS